MRNLYYVPVTQTHLDAGQSGALTDPAGGVALIFQQERIVARAALDALRALGEPVTAVYAGFASTAIVLQDGQELAYYWCDDGITLMALCDSGRTAELQPRTVLLMDRPTYRAYCAANPRPDLERGTVSLPSAAFTWGGRSSALTDAVTQSLTTSLTIFRRLRVASRAIIAKVDRQGNGQAIFLGHGCYPDDAGAMLLRHYSEEESIDGLISSGAITRLAPTPEHSITYFRHYHQPWERCRPYAFRGGTDRFFANYWSPGPEWLYVWTPDGWLASAAMPGAPPDCYYADSEALRDGAPERREWLRRTREFQLAQPPHSLISAYRAQHPGSGEESP